MEKEIVIKPSFEVNSFMKIYYYMFCRPIVIIVCLFVQFTLLFNIISEFYYKENNNDTLSKIAILVIPFFIIFYFYKITKKHLKENVKLKENITRTFNKNYFQEKGDSFNIKYFWKDIVKIVEKKDMFLLYIEEYRVFSIIKSDLKDNQYNDLKALFNSLNIKKKLL